MTTVTVPVDARPIPRLRTRQQLARVVGLVAVLDVLALATSVPLALLLRFGTALWHDPAIVWFTGVSVVDLGWVVPLWALAFASSDAWSRRTFARGGSEFKAVVRASVAAALVGAMACYIVNYDMSRGFYFWFFLVATSLVLLERYAVRAAVTRIRRSGGLLHRVVLVGMADEAVALHQALERRPELGYNVIGVCLAGDVGPEHLPVVGSPDDAVRTCERLCADTLVVASGGVGSSDRLRRIGWDLADSDIDLVVVPSLLDVAGPRIQTRPVSGLPFMHIEPPQAERAMKWGKATFDRVGAFLLLLALSPIFAAVAVVVLVDSGRPIFFRQNRVGAGGRSFGMWKFRSMVPDAEEQRAGLVGSVSPEALLFKLEFDPRVTRAGAWLRRYSLDELPQLFNVLLGQMSLVGPRPPLPEEVARYVDADHRRLMVRPGITGLWQVSGRSDLTWDESVRLDQSYVDNWSMVGDLVILFRTIRAVLRHDGAY